MNKLYTFSVTLISALVVITGLFVYEKVANKAIFFNKATIEEICHDEVTYIRLGKSALTVKVDVDGKPVLCKAEK